MMMLCLCNKQIGWKLPDEIYTRLMKFKIVTRMEFSKNMHRIILVTLNQWGGNKFISLSKSTWAYTWVSYIDLQAYICIPVYEHDISIRRKGYKQLNRILQDPAGMDILTWIFMSFGEGKLLLMKGW